MESPENAKTLTKILLVFGIISSLLCIGTDIIAAMSWEGYSYRDQAVSELGAVGAPTRSLTVPLAITFELLVIAFGVGVLRSAGKKSALRITGILLAIFGVVSLTSFLFPMNPRGVEQSFTGSMHLIFTGVAILLMLLFIGFGAATRGKGFRIYSIVTIMTMLIFGVLAMMQAPQVEAGLPTPWLGVIERVSYYSPQLWILVFAILLFHDQRSTAGTPCAR